VRGARARFTLATSALLVVAGVVIAVQGVLAGGTLGVLVGAMFAAAGALRIYLIRR
jgi:hypothetical protein